MSKGKVKVKVALEIEVDLDAYDREYGQEFTLDEVRADLQERTTETMRMTLDYLPVTVTPLRVAQ